MTSDHRPSYAPLFDGAPYAYGAVAPAGATLFTAGACPIDEHGIVIAANDHAGQARAALANLLVLLDAHGAGPEHLVRTTVYVVGTREDLATAWTAIVEALSPHQPPSTLLGVSVLGYPNQLVEIDAVAALADPISRS